MSTTNNFPYLPTDSLYKFCALSGLIMLFASIYFTLKNYHEINQESIKLDGQINLYNREVEDITTMYNNIKSELKSLCDLCGCNCIDSAGNMVFIPDDEYVKPENKNLKKSVDSLYTIYSQKEAELFSKSNQIDTNRELLNSNANFIKSMSTVAAGLIILSFVLIIYGFRSWYRKIQIYQDLLIQKQASK